MPNKIILKCPKCKKKMKIQNAIGKYKCPSCNEIYKYNKINKLKFKTLFILSDAAVAFNDFSNKVKFKVKTLISKFKK